MSNKKRLIVEIDEALHTDVKRRALFKNLTIRKWILIAIFEKIKKEKETE